MRSRGAYNPLLVYQQRRGWLRSRGAYDLFSSNKGVAEWVVRLQMTPSLSNNKGLAERNSGVPMNPPLFRKKNLYNIHILYNNLCSSQMLITRQSRIPQRNLLITPLPHVAIYPYQLKRMLLMMRVLFATSI